MNQTKKRLAIIKLAISMTDTETIQLQVLKLGLLKTDSRMREILTNLNEQNYAQAQRLISEYIQTPSDTIVQRTDQEEGKVPKKPITEEESLIKVKEVFEEKEKELLTLKEKIQQAKDQAIIDQFELFTEDTEEEIETLQEEEVYDDFQNIEPKTKNMSTDTINYDALLNIDAKDVLVDNITLDISKETQDTFSQEEIEKDFSTHLASDSIQIEKINQENTDIKIATKEITSSKIKNDIYQAIPHIEQKLKNISNQYPPIEKSNILFDSVNEWMMQISKMEYTETDVEKKIKKSETLSKAEAAQLLLLCAATESKYAQFRIARALYKGEILQKNLSEAFTLINRLAINDNFPEAICDLAQFYEKGIGIAKDKKRAESLYKEAMDLGIQRAIDHYERIHKENKKLLSIFKK